MSLSAGTVRRVPVVYRQQNQPPSGSPTAPAAGGGATVLMQQHHVIFSTAAEEQNRIRNERFTSVEHLLSTEMSRRTSVLLQEASAMGSVWQAKVDLTATYAYALSHYKTRRAMAEMRAVVEASRDAAKEEGTRKMEMLLQAEVGRRVLLEQTVSELEAKITVMAQKEQAVADDYRAHIDELERKLRENRHIHTSGVAEMKVQANRAMAERSIAMTEASEAVASAERASALLESARGEARQLRADAERQQVAALVAVEAAVRSAVCDAEAGELRVLCENCFASMIEQEEDAQRREQRVQVHWRDLVQHKLKKCVELVANNSNDNNSNNINDGHNDPGAWIETQVALPLAEKIKQDDRDVSLLRESVMQMARSAVEHEELLRALAAGSTRTINELTLRCNSAEASVRLAKEFNARRDAAREERYRAAVDHLCAESLGNGLLPFDVQRQQLEQEEKLERCEVLIEEANAAFDFATIFYASFGGGSRAGLQQRQNSPRGNTRRFSVNQEEQDEIRRAAAVVARSLGAESAGIAAGGAFASAFVQDVSVQTEMNNSNFYNYFAASSSSSPSAREQNSRPLVSNVFGHDDDGDFDTVDRADSLYLPPPHAASSRRPSTSSRRPSTSSRRPSTSTAFDPQRLHSGSASTTQPLMSDDLSVSPPTQRRATLGGEAQPDSALPMEASSLGDGGGVAAFTTSGVDFGNTVESDHENETEGDNDDQNTNNNNNNNNYNNNNRTLSNQQSEISEEEDLGFQDIIMHIGGSPSGGNSPSGSSLQSRGSYFQSAAALREALHVAVTRADHAERRIAVMVQAQLLRVRRASSMTAGGGGAAAARALSSSLAMSASLPSSAPLTPLRLDESHQPHEGGQHENNQQQQQQHHHHQTMNDSVNDSNANSITLNPETIFEDERDIWAREFERRLVEVQSEKASLKRRLDEALAQAATSEDRRCAAVDRKLAVFADMDAAQRKCVEAEMKVLMLETAARKVAAGGGGSSAGSRTPRSKSPGASTTTAFTPSASTTSIEATLSNQPFLAGFQAAFDPTALTSSFGSRPSSVQPSAGGAAAAGSGAFSQQPSQTTFSGFFSPEGVPFVEGGGSPDGSAAGGSRLNSLRGSPRGSLRGSMRGSLRGSMRGSMTGSLGMYGSVVGSVPFSLSTVKTGGKRDKDLRRRLQQMSSSSKKQRVKSAGGGDGGAAGGARGKSPSAGAGGTATVGAGKPALNIGFQSV